MAYQVKPCNVIVHLEAKEGSYIKSTVSAETCKSSNGVTFISFIYFLSTLDSQSSTLYSNNISKLLLSMGPHITKVQCEFTIDYENQAVGGSLVTQDEYLVCTAPSWSVCFLFNLKQKTQIVP